MRRSRRHYTGGTERASLLLGRTAHQDATTGRAVSGAGRGSLDEESGGLGTERSCSSVPYFRLEITYFFKMGWFFGGSHWTPFYSDNGGWTCAGIRIWGERAIGLGVGVVEALTPTAIDGIATGEGEEEKE